MNARVFTAADANRMLPLVAAIARDIVRSVKELEAHKRQHRKASARLRVAASDDRSLRNEIHRSERELDDLSGELEELGCVLRDAEKGWVDFPGFLGPEMVYFCWSPEEASVTQYHGMGEGFPARKPIPQEHGLRSVDVEVARCDERGARRASDPHGERGAFPS